MKRGGTTSQCGHAANRGWCALRVRSATPTMRKLSAVAGAIRPRGKPFAACAVSGISWSMPKSIAKTYSAKVRPPTASTIKERARPIRSDCEHCLEVCRSQRATPAATKAQAEFIFIVARPGITVFSRGMLKSQPQITANPTDATTTAPPRVNQSSVTL